MNNPTTSPSTPPTPVPLFQALNAYQTTAAIKAAIEHDVFSAIAGGATTAAAVAERRGLAERGTRILLDYLVITQFLTKAGDAYALSPTAATFLVKSSPAYMGGVTEFMLSPTITGAFDHLTEAVRKGGTAVPESGTLAPEHEVWVRFARAMAPMMAMPADGLAKAILQGKSGPMAVLDVSASHGVFGLAFARQNPQATVTGLDWPNVLEVAKQTAAKMGVADRYQTIAGSAFDAPLGGPYDLILLPNFLHHFDGPTIEKFMARLKPALKPGGRVVTVEFVPEEDRVTPPAAAAFALTMLATTPSGDAHTFAEYDRMFRAAGFGASQMQRAPDGAHAIIVTGVN